VIEVKNHSTGRNSRLYRIRKEYEGPAVFRTITDMKLLTRIKKARAEIAKHNSRKYPELNQMTKLVAIDRAAALTTIEATYHAAEDKQAAEARRTYSLAEVEKISRGEIYHTVNPTNFRYDSNFTRLPSELVPLLTIEDNPLHEVDTVNSQMFYSVCLFDPSPVVTKVMRDYLGHLLTIQIKRLQLSQYHDVQRYALSAISGQFYEDLMQLFSMNSRDEVKDLCFTVLFGRNDAIKYSKDLRRFRDAYPNVYRMFTEIKKDGHNRLSILLQRIESDVMLNYVAPAIMQRLPEVKFITKHDSVLPSRLLVSGETAGVASIMAEVIEEVTGLRPKLKIKSGGTKVPPSQSISQSINISTPITPIINTPSLSLYPIMLSKTLQVTENEKMGRGRLIGKMTKKEKKIVSKIIRKNMTAYCGGGGHARLRGGG
jgi:hypothetical protein